MAKGLRSKSKRRFRAIKRATVFAPVENERLQRLAAKQAATAGSSREESTFKTQVTQEHLTISSSPSSSSSSSFSDSINSPTKSITTSSSSTQQQNPEIPKSSAPATEIEMTDSSGRLLGSTIEKISGSSLCYAALGLLDPDELSVANDTPLLELLSHLLHSDNDRCFQDDS